MVVTFLRAGVFSPLAFSGKEAEGKEIRKARRAIIAGAKAAIERR
jgi:hypothetical protein